MQTLSGVSRAREAGSRASAASKSREETRKHALVGERRCAASEQKRSSSREAMLESDNLQSIQKQRRSRKQELLEQKRRKPGSDFAHLLGSGLTRSSNAIG